MTTTADSPDRDRPVVDPNSILNLADQITIFVSIDSTGQHTLWFAGDDKGSHGCACNDCAPHEQLVRGQRGMQQVGDPMDGGHER